MKNPLDPRHKKRQKLVEELFKEDFHKQPASQKAKEIFLQKDMLDKMIEEAAPEFPIDKINKVDVAILRLAVYELFVEKTTPPKVVVDEAIELAKEYGAATSSGFVNGVLGKLIQK